MPAEELEEQDVLHPYARYPIGLIRDGLAASHTAPTIQPYIRGSLTDFACWERHHISDTNPAIDLKLKMVLATSHNACLLQHRKESLDCFSWGCYFQVIDFDHCVEETTLPYSIRQGSPGVAFNANSPAQFTGLRPSP
ncbi:hypothetical protein FOXB_06236 [Fusarium oxysporum f. sp. conglutinans Fo5176]|uniref:Uncharacterized protein n=1 Tax=Fusarium oxysporum (strain Fo5176) TaxID=660025 RepID=F9FIK7_FUSOF|nr:hypothetical protein FOXB_06236 [Fusarium oxysporum f. sp. conglutinans Fo5176]